MNILYLSPGNTIPIANNLVRDGHKVYYWPAKEASEGMGLIPIKDWKSYVPKVDLIVFDDCEGITKPEFELFTLGKPVVSGNSFFDRLENDRIFGKDIFKKVGLTISDCAQFTDLKEAIKFIKKNPDKWVFKANGQGSRTLGYVGKQKDGSDVIERMAFYESHLKNNKDMWDKKLGVDFVLERCVDGIEVACGAYWDGQDFTGININWEHKKLGVGNVGVATGEMGTAIRAVEANSKFYLGTLEKLKPLLRQFPYRTYVDLNCIVNNDNAYVLEITSRFGYPIEAGLDFMSALSTADRYMLLGKGQLHKLGNKFWKDKFGVTVVCATFGWPYKVSYKEFGAEQPFKFPEQFRKNIYLMDVDKVNNHYQTSDDAEGEGHICDVCGSGSSIDEARDQAFGIIKKIDLPGIYYRIDIGEKADEDYKQMKRWGWLS